MPKSSSGSKLSNAEYEKLGKLIATVLDNGYWDKKRLYRISFVRGMLYGFGGAIGATVLVSIAIALLSLFNTIPFLNDIADAIRRSLAK